jgi:hypothetical protein
MKLYEASEFFDNLILETDKKSEITIYESFIAIISDLEEREFDKEDLEDIEYNLDMLELNSNPDNRKRFYRKSLNEFKKYLKDQFSLITEGYYIGIGLALGVAFGAAFSSVLDVGNSVVFGMLIGLAIGASKDSEAKKQNRVLKTKLS